ncbi:HlyC/CorC family transporter [Eubacterium oxidoreducens]|uniref:Hemolysin, contains CBS domains n=1 Tax=Eubacterium oxidoreducens TaxID=1732 RepID=A0A1G6C1P7_EUBOX|nr:hemolysin family protein [Eubacterium oxidoreducens]SDB26748.1 Hemolysin, contains CBS domains [Eubacterium oxidoreducens]
MDPYDAIRLIIVILLIFLSAFFSSSETAFTTASNIRLRTLAADGNPKAQKALDLCNNIERLLSAILIGNNVVNLSASSLATTLGIHLFGSIGAGIATGALTIIVLIFGEIAPKNYATRNSEKIAMKYSGFFTAYSTVLRPIIFIITAIAMGFLKLFRADTASIDDVMTEEELKTIVDDSHENGMIEPEERQMIYNVFDFDDAQAKEIMVPRPDMDFVKLNDTYEEVIEIYRKNMHTRLPIYEDSTDNVIGILNIKDLLLIEDTNHFSIRDYIREAFFTFEHQTLDDLFAQMRKESAYIAIVLDEYGATAGMITLEDLLEEIVGEIRDEYDGDEKDDLEQIGEGEYLIQGVMNLEDLGKEIGIPLSSEDYDSIGGYLLEKLDHLPNEKDSLITDDGLFFRIEKMDKNRIDTIYMKLPKPPVTDKKSN